MKLITWNVQWCRGVDGRVESLNASVAAGLAIYRLLDGALFALPPPRGSRPGR